MLNQEAGTSEVHSSVGCLLTSSIGCPLNGKLIEVLSNYIELTCANPYLFLLKKLAQTLCWQSGDSATRFFRNWWRSNTVSLCSKLH